MKGGEKMIQIRFKSRPDFWKKEQSGCKPNTIREFFDEKDIRKKLLDDFIKDGWKYMEIVMVNTDNNQSFTRTITDVSKYKGFYIISWRT
jgi:ABC-type branched-subunit amino acid transport system substrate-binding protein